MVVGLSCVVLFRPCVGRSAGKVKADQATQVFPRLMLGRQEKKVVTRAAAGGSKNEDDAPLARLKIRGVF